MGQGRLAQCVVVFHKVCGGIPLFESICLQYLEIVFEFDVGVEVSV